MLSQSLIKSDNDSQILSLVHDFSIITNILFMFILILIILKSKNEKDENILLNHCLTLAVALSLLMETFFRIINLRFRFMFFIRL